jgi:hypothetical protein
MKFMKHVSPRGALGDLRDAIKVRNRTDVLFMVLSLLLTGVVLLGFYKDSQFEKPYKREVIYVESWRADRTLQEIIAQQKIDEPKRLAREAEIKAKAEKRRQEFKKIDDGLKAWGI